MHWEIWDVESRNLVEDFDTEAEALQAAREILAVNRPDYIDALAVAAMYDEGESRAEELPPALTGETLRARLAEIAQADVAASANSVHERIRKWLAEEGWHVREVNDPQSSFNVMATLQSGDNVNIFQYRSHIDHITLSQHCVFDEPARLEISRLPIAVLKEAVHQIYRDVSIMGLDLSGLAVPSAEMTIRTCVYFDGLTKDSLIQRIYLTIRALSLALRTFVLALDSSINSAQKEEANLPVEQVSNGEPAHSKGLQEADSPSVQAANGESGYSAEVTEADDPSEPPSNVISLRRPPKMPPGEDDSQAMAS
jgi:hypothetical protein